MGRKLLLIVVLLVLGCSVLAALMLAALDQRPAAKPVLQLSGSRGARGMTLTSRENVPLTKCDATLLDQGDAEWLAVLPNMRPSETISIPWSAFKQNGQPLPDYIALSRRHVIVSCFLEGQERRSAGLRFEAR